MRVTAAERCASLSAGAAVTPSRVDADDHIAAVDTHNFCYAKLSLVASYTVPCVQLTALALK